jgi:hypothetical protein
MAPKRTTMRGMGQDAFFSGQQASDPASQQAVKAASDLVKATFYLTPDLVMKLEEVRMKRLRDGVKMDKSALVREAIEQLAS